MGSRGERSIIVAGRLAKQGEELVGVSGDQLGELRVAGAELLEDGLEHLGLLLHHLAELLELGVGAEPLEIAQALPTGSSCSSRGGDTGARSRSATTTAAARTRAAALLGGEVEQVDIPVIVTASGSTGGRGRGGGSRGSRGTWGSRGSLASASGGLLKVLRDTLETS